MWGLKLGLWCAALSLGGHLSAGSHAHAHEDERAGRPTVGLVLSGGGARGAAHVGVIKVLEELRIPVDLIAGTSMGAIVGGLYASGMTAEGLVRVVEEADWSVLLTDRPPRAQRSFRRKSDDIGFLVDFDVGVNKSGLILPTGFVQGQNLEMALKRLTLLAASIGDFDKLPIPFRAVATDIVTGEAVILDSGDLATAMRASMSAPGIFRPVRYDGRTLVDGGVANNLPVQVVQEMGADVVIVVDVGFPLLPESELQSAVDVTKQMLTILINARARDQIARLSPTDVLISPELGDLGSQEFQRMPEALRIGENEAREVSDALAKLSVSGEQYAAYRRKLEAGRGDLPVIDSVIVENESRLSPRVIETRLADQTGGPLDLDQIEADIANIYGFDTFEAVTWRVREEADGNRLTVSATEKSWGPNYLRFGINLEDDFDGNSNYNVAARFTRTEINEKGGELRAELQIGESPRIFAELYQPLDFASRWFVNPQIAAERSTSALFNEGLQIAQFRSDQLGLSLEGGRQFGNWGEIRVGITRGSSDTGQQIGAPEFESTKIDLTSLVAGFGYDTIDRVAIPRSGTNIALGWNGSRESLESDGTFDIVQFFFLKPQSWGNNTILHWWNLGRTTKDETPGITPFALGGLFSLSGYATNELAGKHLGIGRLLYYRRLGEQPLPGLDTTIYVGASVEAGNVWQNSSDIGFSNALIAGSAFVVLDTILGPLYIAYGAAEGSRRSAYLFLGQTF